MSVGLEKGTVRVVPYDPEWAKLFEKEKADLLAVLKAAELDCVVEHVGSTAVRGLSAKPVIDVAIGFRDTGAVVRGLRALMAAGRDYVKGANQPGMMFMARGDPRTVHYHLVVIGSPAWAKLFAFRNFLRRHAGVAADYGQLKETLARRFSNSRVDYTRYKRPTLRAILLRAYGEERRRRHASSLRHASLITAYERELDAAEAAEVAPRPKRDG